MAKKIEITEHQVKQFNQMLLALKRIGEYMSPDQLQRDSDKQWGLSYEESLEMAYENIQEEAKAGRKGVKAIVIK